jgi:hypothetical protein
VSFEGGGVGVEGGGRDDVAELPDGVEATVPVGVEVPLDAGPGRPGQADDLGPGNALGGEPEDFHPPLDLRRRVVEAVGSDLGEDGRGDDERAHGILPAGEAECRSGYPHPGVAEKLSPGRLGYIAVSAQDETMSGLLAATLWTLWKPVSAVCKPTISTCTRSMPTIP